MNFTQIESLITLSQESLPDSWLEGLQQEYGEHHNYYRFLYHLLQTRKPKVALEIGVYQGVASAYMSAAALTYGGRVIGIDINLPHIGLQAINERYNNYHFILGDSTKAETWNQVYNLAEEHGKIGVVYQDSSHHYTASCQEWEMYTRLLDEGAVWICDDITPSFHDPLIDPPGFGMVQYFNSLPGSKRLYKDVLHFGNTQGIILPP